MNDPQWTRPSPTRAPTRGPGDVQTEGRLPARPWRITEDWRRGVYLWVTGLATVSQLGLLGTLASGAAGPPLWWPLLGAAVCALAWAALRYRWVHWLVVDYAILTAASVLVLTQLAFRSNSLLAGDLFGAVFLLLAAFSILTFRHALLYAAALVAAVTAALSIHGGDMAVIWSVMLVALLTAHLSAFGRSVSRERAEAGAFERLAHTDVLTGLFNRRAMYTRMEEEFNFLRPVGLILLDIDHFKRINDRHGHDVGDEVLRDLAGALTRLVGQRGYAARWGGEEFLLLIPQVQDVQEISAQLCDHIRSNVSCAGHPVTVSAGLAVSSEVERPWDWVKLADARLYTAKQLGRNRLELAYPTALDIPLV